MNRPNRGRAGLALRGAALAGGVMALLAGCDLLKVDTPSRIAAAGLETPANAALLTNGAVADFECAFGGYAAMSGLIGDELDDATQTADRYPYDSRNIHTSDRRYAVNECDALGVYTPLNKARASADNVYRLLQGWSDAEVPKRAELSATTAVYAGYGLVLLGEGFCSGVISQVNGATIQYGAELQPPQLLAEAESRFTAALAAAQASGRTDLAKLALLGRARARLDAGNYAGAKADAVLVDSAFAFTVSASDVSDRRSNRIWSQNSGGSGGEATSVGALYRSLNDPRVPVSPVLANGVQKKSVTGVPLFRQGKYATANTPFMLASGLEARLIIAEVDARAGTLAPAIATLNAFRGANGQPAFAGSTQADVLNDIIDQRRRQFFLDGHHLGDLIRYNLPLTPAAGATYPGGGVYGTSRCLPIPDVERLNNPNLH
jgi:hypothetical protein